MGEHNNNCIANNEEQTIKIAVISVSAFIDTCAVTLHGIGKSGVGPAGATHLQSVQRMLEQCAASLRSYAAAYKTPDYTNDYDDESLPPHEKEPDYAQQDEAYLEAEQENKLAQMLGLIPMNEDESHG
jgi:hypothetical protein